MAVKLSGQVLFVELEVGAQDIKGANCTLGRDLENYIIALVEFHENKVVLDKDDLIQKGLG